MLLIAFDHLVMLREGFHLGAYVGVLMIVAMGLAIAGAAALAVDGTRGAWWFVFAQSAVTALGFLVTGRTGVPVAPADVTPALWRGPEAQTLLYAAGVTTVLSGWVLLGRKAPHPRRRASYEAAAQPGEPAGAQGRDPEAARVGPGAGRTDPDGEGLDGEGLDGEGPDPERWDEDRPGRRRPDQEHPGQERLGGEDLDHPSGRRDRDSA